MMAKLVISNHGYTQNTHRPGAVINEINASSTARVNYSEIGSFLSTRKTAQAAAHASGHNTTIFSDTNIEDINPTADTALDPYRILNSMINNLTNGFLLLTQHPPNLQQLDQIIASIAQERILTTSIILGNRFIANGYNINILPNSSNSIISNTNSPNTTIQDAINVYQIVMQQQQIVNQVDSILKLDC